MVRTAVFIGPASFGADPGAGEDALLGGWPALDRVPERIAALGKTFKRLGYACTALDGHLTAAELGQAVRAAIDRSDPADVLVVHVFSHGEVTPSGALHVIGADGVRHEFTDVERWLRNIVDAQQSAPMTLFLLDICYAGAAARFDWLTRTGAADGRCWVIAACAPYELAYAGRFTDAVTRVLRDLADGRLDIDESFPNAPITTVAQQIRRDVTRRAAAAGGLPQQVTASLIDISSTPPDLPFFPNLRHQQNPRRDVRTRVDAAVTPFLDDVDEALDPAHFIGRAAGQGSTTTGRLTGCFSGRGQQVKELAPWLNLQDRVGLRVVTGSPGAGKSALIGVLVCAAHPALRDSTRAVWDRLEQRPYPNHHLAAVHARERTPAQVVDSIARQLSVPAENLVAAVAARPEPPVIVVDALDEAIDGRAIMDQVLLPLATATRADGQPVRVLVGMRPWDEFRPLRDLAEAGGGLHDLDQVDPDQLCDDVEEYVGRLMRADARWRTRAYVGARASFAREVAETLTLNSPDRQWGAFLVAGLFTYHVLNTRTAPIRDVDEVAALARTVPRTLPDLLELDLRTHPSAAEARALLGVLAHAKGDGIPAEVLTDALGRRSRNRGAVLGGLRAVAFYLRHSADVDGTTLYRLFHQGLADHLQSPFIESRVVDGLLESVTPRAGAARRWELAAPYLLRHLAGHARLAGHLDRLVSDPGFLVAADPGPLLTELDSMPAHSPLRPIIGAYRLATAGPYATEDRQSRRQALAIAAVRSGVPGLAHDLAALPDPDPLAWQPLWVTASPVTAVASTDSVAILGTADGDVEVRDLGTGAILGEHRQVHSGRVTAICAGRARGHPVALSTGEDRMLATTPLGDSGPLGGSGERESIPIGDAASIVAPGEVGGREMALVVLWHGGASLWDLAIGGRVADLQWKLKLAESFTVGDDLIELYRGPEDPKETIVRLNGTSHALLHDAPVTAAAGTAVGGRVVVFTGDAAGTITAWDVASRRVLGRLRLPGAIDGLHATDRAELLAGTASEVYAFRFQPAGPAVASRPVRHGLLSPVQPNGVDLSLRWGHRAIRPADPKPLPLSAPATVFRYASRSDVGAMPTLNCDASYAGPRFLAVADGVDDGPGGDAASRAVVKAMATLDAGGYPEGPEAAIRTAIETAKLRLRDAQTSDLARYPTGTTVTAMIIHGHDVFFAHIGDSRIYLLHDGVLSRITADSRPRGESGLTPQTSVLTTEGEEVGLEYGAHRAVLGDRFLLCTRGLSNVVTDEALSAILGRHPDPREAIEDLVRTALEQDAPENVTAVIGDVVEG